MTDDDEQQQQLMDTQQAILDGINAVASVLAAIDVRLEALEGAPGDAAATVDVNPNDELDVIEAHHLRLMARAEME